MLKSVSIVEKQMSIDWYKNACLIVIQKNSNVTVDEKKLSDEKSEGKTGKWKKDVFNV